MVTTVIECVDLSAELAFFTSEAGFRVDVVRPADDPRSFVLSRDGASVELRRGGVDRPVRLSIPGAVPGVSPGGSVIEPSVAERTLAIPENRPSLTVVPADTGAFGVGRAGMEYRDLLPDRWGGRFIASHIRIGDGGDVADWVHFHRIRFQMIFVASGWVDVVYEDQGPPFRLHEGDSVLQPPEIRHRVLRSSPGLEVIEVGCPAEHDTFADHDLSLPTVEIRPERDFGGQRFVRHVAAGAHTVEWLDASLTVRDTGIGDATGGLAGAVVVVADDRRAAMPTQLVNRGEFVLIVGLRGRCELVVDGSSVQVEPRTSVAVPPGVEFHWMGTDERHEALIVSLPAGAIEKVFG